VIVRTGSAQTCSLFDGVPLTQSTGYLSSLTAAEVGVGTAACPWLVDAPAGQRVNLTLYPFLPAASVDDGGCRGVAAGWTVVVADGNITLEVPACLATAPPAPDGRLVYSSHSSTLRIHLEHVRGPFDVGLAEHTLGHILIRYQGLTSNPFVTVIRCCDHNYWWRHLVNAYEAEAGMVLFAGKTVWSMPERLRSFMTRRYINPRYLCLYLYLYCRINHPQYYQ